MDSAPGISSQNPEASSPQAKRGKSLQRLGLGVLYLILCLVPGSSCSYLYRKSIHYLQDLRQSREEYGPHHEHGNGMCIRVV